MLGPRRGEEPTEAQKLGNSVVNPIVPDGRTGWDQFGQLMTWTLPDKDGFKKGWPLRDVRECTCMICGRGWELTSESLQDQQWIDDREVPVHGRCLQGFRELTERYFWTGLMYKLRGGGMIPFHVEEGEPQYPGSTKSRTITILNYDEDRTPSPVKIAVHRRKRVWDITIHGLGDFTEEFKDRDVTKGYSEESNSYYIHAWTEEECLSALKIFKARWEASGLVIPYSREEKKPQQQQSDENTASN